VYIQGRDMKNETFPTSMGIYIGTSGFSYPYWKNRFYPEKLPASKWLQYYATQFNTLEINSSFYRFPKVENLRKSALQTPEDFVFTVKAHKIITHTRRMKNAKDKITEFMDIVNEGLGDKLGCTLFQMPPSYFYTDDRLNDVVNHLTSGSRNVIEFRHASWWNPVVYQALDACNVHFCSVSFPGLPEDNISTGGSFYKRMHGVPELFTSSYTKRQLQTLARQLPSDGQNFIYFNNTMFEAGYSNARLLQQLVG
jgi:uncharacterized protein YecE (DUF72 family)